MLKVDLMSPSSCYGVPWDDMSLGQVVGIVIFYDSSAIYSLRFIYVNDNIYKMSIHGDARENCQMIILDYPTEFLTAVDGCRSSFSVVKRITFVTNRATYGPFGNQSVRSADCTFACHQGGKEKQWIRGFYGTLCDGSIGSLGVIIQTPTVSQPESSQPGIVKSEGQQK